MSFMDLVFDSVQPLSVLVFYLTITFSSFLQSWSLSWQPKNRDDLLKKEICIDFVRVVIIIQS